ncbi:MAG TPA: cation-translocating P-type ATPase [Myxococcaceae bacterium]|nr:cation-translocating P-type ATPase [Myxococcaceae bacterium]
MMPDTEGGSTGQRGLTGAEAGRRLSEDGPNELVREAPTPAWKRLLEQFRSPVILLLLGACGVSAALGEWVNAIAIGAIVILNGLVGYFQEARAEKAVQALRSMTAPRARVIRDGTGRVVPASEIVRGDLLVLEAGDIVAADARLLRASRLSTREAALTGESAAVGKGTTPAREGVPLAERNDHVFMGTAVATGTGVAEVVATGMRTELGRIAHLLNTAEVAETPLQQRLEKVSHTLIFLSGGIVVVVALLGLLRGVGWLEVFMSAVSLAVAAVPEGLPTVVTIALAIGVQRMADRHVLIRRLPAVETLGSATVICTDKTGTLTTGRMAVREVWGSDHEAVLGAAAACCDAELGDTAGEGVGDPTELAILFAAAERGILRRDLERDNPRVHENPFDADRKRMSVLRRDGVLYVKGAPESVMALCEGDTSEGERANRQMGARGLRVLAIAVGSGESEQALRLLGLLGLADPPRTEAVDAIREARAAGIQTVMITGDQHATALAIAREMGVLREGEAPEGRVHARATPEDKLRIVRDWKARGAIVAMTGDGVNDAPALREAHIGVAMGQTGTEVTREAASMVLSDDNFASIIAAVREGRGVFTNIQKTLVYLLSGNAGELLVMFLAALAGYPLPLLPLQLLWINLVTDGLPGLALVMDPPARDAMAHPPRNPATPMLGRREWMTILLTGVLEATLVLSVFVWALSHRELDEARSLAFAVLVFCELFRAFAARSSDLLFWEVGAFTNLRLVGIIALSVIIQLALHHLPFTQRLFGLSPLPAWELAMALGLGFIPVTLLELFKLVRRVRRSQRPQPAS